MKITSLNCNALNQTGQNYKTGQQNSPAFKSSPVRIVIESPLNPAARNKLARATMPFLETLLRERGIFFRKCRDASLKIKKRYSTEAQKVIDGANAFNRNLGLFRFARNE